MRASVEGNRRYDYKADTSSSLEPTEELQERREQRVKGLIDHYGSIPPNIMSMPAGQADKELLCERM